MLAAMAAFVANDALMKIASATLPIGQLICMRGLMMLPILGAVLVVTVPPGQARIFVHPGVVLRSIAEIGAAVLYLSALFRMPIADCTAILQFTPLALTAGAALFFGMPVGWRRWSAAVVGLVGVLIIIRPGATAFNPYAILALLSVLFIVARDLTTRSLGTYVPATVIAFASVLALVVAGIAMMPFEAWQWPQTEATVALLATSLILLCAQYWIIFAMRTGNIVVVAPFRYSIILWAILAGFLVWGEVPDLPTWIGIAVVTGAGLYTFVREYRLARAARQ
jgi:drug/metabolite transporter (DMT)-like permease